MGLSWHWCLLVLVFFLVFGYVCYIKLIKLSSSVHIELSYFYMSYYVYVFNYTTVHVNIFVALSCLVAVGKPLLFVYFLYRL